MGLSKDQIEGLRMSGELHDIGKIHVPAEILSKPGQISEAEYTIIKTHSQVGHDILKTIEFPWPVAKIVLQHHERIDGSGYPSGLKGKDILLEAKILAVADVTEAMATHRPYRPALSIEESLMEISKNKGILYDPKVVDICLKVFKQKKFQFE
jgi:HD-GYP domain-containing protein (c-di-GMP phosphodiesterase class II)